MASEPAGARRRRLDGTTRSVSVLSQEALEHKELLDAIRVAVATALTPRQRRVFVAIVLNSVPLDVLATELSTNRNALYKALFDARRKVRTYLVANGYMEPE